MVVFVVYQPIQSCLGVYSALISASKQFIFWGKLTAATFFFVFLPLVLTAGAIKVRWATIHTLTLGTLHTNYDHHPPRSPPPPPPHTPPPPKSTFLCVFAKVVSDLVFLAGMYYKVHYGQNEPTAEVAAEGEADPGLESGSKSGGGSGGVGGDVGEDTGGPGRGGSGGSGGANLVQQTELIILGGLATGQGQSQGGLTGL